MVKSINRLVAPHALTLQAQTNSTVLNEATFVEPDRLALRFEALEFLAALCRFLVQSDVHIV